MQKLFVAVLMMTMAVVAIAQDKPAAPARAGAPVETLTAADYDDTLKNLGAQIAADQVTILSLRRQAFEWRARAQAAEEKLQRCAAPTETTSRPTGTSTPTPTTAKPR